MATRLTPNLRLRLSDDLTADAVYNLGRIDALGSTFFINSAETLFLRNQEQIVIHPRSPDVGGSGSGGIMTVDGSLTVNEDAIITGTTQLSEMRLLADISLPATSFYSALKAHPSLAASTTWTMPLTDGTNGEVMMTDGAGQLDWATVLTDDLNENHVRIGAPGDLAVQVDTNSVGDIFADTTNGLTYKAGSIVDADINSAADITRTKLATGGADHVLINDGVGEIASEAQLAITRGGTGAATASDARDNLGLTIGTDVQAWDPQLDDIAALTPTDSNVIVGDGANWVAESGATARASLGLTIGTDVQAWDTQLDDIAALTPTDGNVIVGDGANWVAESGDTARTSLGLGSGDSPTFNGLTITSDLAITEGGTGASTASDARDNLGLTIGTNVQAWDAQLDDIAALAVTDGNIIVGDGINWVAESGATARTSLGLGSIATQDANAVDIDGGAIDNTPIGGTTPAAVTATSVTTSTVDVATAGAMNIGATVGANNMTLGAATSTVVVAGNLQVDGTTTTVNSDTLDVTDANITVNNGGNQASADDVAGLTVEMSDATDVKLLYDKDVPTRWKIGDAGSEIEVADISTAQTFSNKTINGARHTTATWVTGDGASKAIAHNFNTTDIAVELYEIDTGETVFPDTTVRTNVNTLTLTASQAPTGSGWKVLIKEVGA